MIEGVQMNQLIEIDNQSPVHTTMELSASITISFFFFLYNGLERE